MNNSVADDYFAFMSDKGARKDPARRKSAIARPKVSPLRSDTIDFVDVTQIEVVESVMSDTMLEKVLRRGSGA
jgi:hypothetical protein